MSVTAGQKRFIPTPPEKGVFPLDHEGQCKSEMLKYMICLQKNNQDNSLCRIESKTYLDCRMKHNLMAKEDWTYLGYGDLEEEKRKSQ